jgi:hypothetical protein
MSLKDLAQQMKATGRKGDTELVHMTKREVAGLQALAEAAGGTLTKNPKTGLPEASFLERLLPTIIGVGVGMFAGPMAGAAAGAAVGGIQNKEDPLMGALMGGIGGYGGAGLGAGLNTAGTAAAGAAATPAAQAAGQAAVDQATKEFAAQQALAEGAKVGGAEAAQMVSQGQIMPPMDVSVPNYDLLRGEAMGSEYLKAMDAFKEQPFLSRMGQGIQALGTEGGPTAFLEGAGGLGGLAKSGAMGAAPLIYDYLTPRPVEEVEEEEEDNVDLMGRYTYDAGYTGGTRAPGTAFSGESVYFDPKYRRMFAAKGGEVKKYADGGEAAAPSSDADTGPSRGMTGMSRDAMDYLYGLSPASTQGAVRPMTAMAAQPTAVADPSQKYVFDAATNMVVANPNYAPPKAPISNADVLRSMFALGGPMNQQGMFAPGGDGGTFGGGSFSGRGAGLDDAAFGVLGYSQGPLGYLSPTAMMAGRVAGDYLGARADNIGAGDFGTLGAANAGNLAYGGIGTFSDVYGNVGTYSSPASLAAYDASWGGGSGDHGGGSHGDSGPSGSSGDGGASASGPGDSWRVGGHVYADGGLASLARGGMKAGGFVVPADVVSMVGEGNTDAGYERIKRMLPGATPIKGKDGGQADTVKTSIEGKQPARIAHGEMYVPPATVKRAGGAKKLYAMMDKVRKQATGNKKQIKPVNLKKALA